MTKRKTRGTSTRRMSGNSDMRAARPKRADVTLRPSDVLHISDGAPFTMETAAALRRALLVVCDDRTLNKQIRRDCHIEPVRSAVIGANADRIAKKRRREIDANQRVAVIIPNYNYARFLPDAILSAWRQTRPPDEIIIVDDASTDNSVEVVQKHLGRWTTRDGTTHIKLIQHPTNRGNVGAARNTGIAATDAQYILCLDSDDMIEPAYIETCLKAIQDDQGIGVVYTGVQTLEQQDGGSRRRLWPDWPPEFNWDWMTRNQMPWNTCIPTASMYRREFWRRAGGYDEGIASAEDCEFWTRALSCGWEAVKCTAEPLFVYRRHGPSMTTTRKQTNIAAWNRTYHDAKPLAAPTGKDPVRRDYTRPAVSVIIPVGPKHAALLPTAIASVLAQSIDRWEIVVVNDTAGALPLEPWPFIKQVEGKCRGVAAARNAGIEAATAPLMFFLDADDYIMPDTLAHMVTTYAQGQAGYVYSGWWYSWADKKPEARQAGDYERAAWVREDSLGGLHGVSVLMAKLDAERIGRFDEDVPSGFEDREFFARCAIFGLCGVPVRDSLLVYRWDAGTQRNAAQRRLEDTTALMQRRYGPFIRGEKQMAGCCGGNAEAVQMAQEILNESGMAFNASRAPASGDAPRMVYKGPRQGGVTFFGKYEGWAGMEPIPVHPGDVERLQGLQWELVADFPHVPQPAAIYPSGEQSADHVIASGDYDVPIANGIAQQTPELQAAGLNPKAIHVAA